MKLFKYKFGYVVSIGQSEEEARLNLYYKVLKLIVEDNGFGDIYPYILIQTGKSAILLGETDELVEEHKFWE